jgi:hypothetical protein
MRIVDSALLAFSLSSVFILSAATPIDDPKDFVTDVYLHLVAVESTNFLYKPPEDIYTDRLGKLLRADKQKAKGEVGCLDFVFWVNGQDWKITNLTVTSADAGRGRKIVIAKFLNTGEPQEIHFDFRNNGRWLLDDVHSVSAPAWT